MDGKDWSAPDLWLAEHAGLWDAFWPRGGGCVVNAGPNGKGEEISKERILAAEATDGAVPCVAERKPCLLVSPSSAGAGMRASGAGRSNE